MCWYQIKKRKKIDNNLTFLRCKKKEFTANFDELILKKRTGVKNHNQMINVKPLLQKDIDNTSKPPLGVTDEA